MANNIISKPCTGGCGRKIRSTWNKCQKCRGVDAARWNEYVDEKVKASWTDDRKSLRPASHKKIIACLNCTEDFKSDGPGHRICDGCKCTSAWRGGGATDYSFASSRRDARGAQ